MLWYKGWRETQFKVWLTLGSIGVYLFAFYHLHKLGPPPVVNPVAGWTITAATLAVVAYTWLAGAGIATQPSFQATKGLYGSTQFTLSMPVSRLRLLAVRAGVGWLETAGLLGLWCALSWLVLPWIRNQVAIEQMFEYSIALVTCMSAPYFLSVLLATFLDEQWRMIATMIASGGLGLISMIVQTPPSIDLVRAIVGEHSALLSHTMPWEPMTFSAGISVLLFLAALKIVRIREY